MKLHTPTHVRGLDSIRFIAALWVMMTHYGPPNITGNHFLSAFLKFAFTGTPAVIVFFVVSGFCIHYPYRAKQFNLLEFYSKRLIRICLPMLIATWIAAILSIPSFNVYDGFILWSLVAEVIYYVLYPAIRMLRQQVGWFPIFVGSFLIALIVVLLKPQTGIGYYHDYGPYLNWILGLPCWILGCIIASRFSGIGRKSNTSIWGWRLTVWFASSLSVFLQLKGIIGNQWTMNIFAVLVFFWIQKEISHAQKYGSWTWMENLGSGTYSLYLFHVPAFFLYQRLNIHKMNLYLDWTLQTFFIATMCYLFYLLIEHPCHSLSRRISQLA